MAPELEGVDSNITKQQYQVSGLISKTIPIFKNKGDKKDIENYRPIANLCAASKVFEKLILKRILEIQESHNVDLTNSAQHGFKRKRSTASLSLTLQTLIAHALDDDNYAIMASLDLSAAFDVVNIKLLLYFDFRVPSVNKTYSQALTSV